MYLEMLVLWCRSWSWQAVWILRFNGRIFILSKRKAKEEILHHAELFWFWWIYSCKRWLPLEYHKKILWKNFNTCLLQDCRSQWDWKSKPDISRANNKTTKREGDSVTKPTMIQDDFMGDFYLGCPSCKEAIHFPLIRNPNHIYDKRPKQCSKCGEEFDWSDEMKGGTQWCMMKWMMLHRLNGAGNGQKRRCRRKSKGFSTGAISKFIWNMPGMNSKQQ